MNDDMVDIVARSNLSSFLPVLYGENNLNITFSVLRSEILAWVHKKLNFSFGKKTLCIEIFRLLCCT